jgi:hypothetical protein
LGNCYDDKYLYVGAVMGGGDSPEIKLKEMNKVKEFYEIEESRNPSWYEYAWMDN